MEEEQLTLEQATARKRIKILLIAANVILSGILLFDIVYKVVTSSKKEDDFICLGDYDKKESKKIYDELILNDGEGNYEVVDVYDYGIYGNYLHLSKNHIYGGEFSSFDSIYVKEVKNKKYSYEVLNATHMNKSLQDEYIDGGIDLKSLGEGTYLLYEDYLTERNSDKPHSALKIASEKNIDKVVYSLPDENEVRKMITLKNHYESPSLVLNVEKINLLPGNVYDFVYIGSSDSKFLESVPAYLKYAVCSSIKEAYSYEAAYCFVEGTSDDVIGSYYLNNERIKNGNLSSNKYLSLYDENDYIRELGGYLMNAGSSTKGVDASFAVASKKGINDNGKYTLIIPSSITYNDLIKLF